MIKTYTESDKSIIYSIINDRQELIPLFTSTLKIPEQVKAYDENLFVVYNNYKKRFELHSIESYMPSSEKWSTYQMVLFDILDYRTLEKIYINDIQKHGKRLFDDVDDRNELLTKGYEKTANLRMRKASDKVVSYLSGTFDSY